MTTLIQIRMVYQIQMAMVLVMIKIQSITVLIRMAMVCRMQLIQTVLIRIRMAMVFQTVRITTQRERVPR